MALTRGPSKLTLNILFTLMHDHKFHSSQITKGGSVTLVALNPEELLGSHLAIGSCGASEKDSFGNGAAGEFFH